MNAVPHNNSCPSVRTPREGCGEYANYWKLLIDRKMVNHKTGKVIAQKAVLPNFDSGFILGNEAKGITGILDQALNDPAVQDVVTAENMVYEKFSNWNRDINNADAEAIEEAKRVRDMAAQVAVQKTVEAGKVKTQPGAMWSLDSTGRELSNAQQETKVSYSLNDSVKNAYTLEAVRKKYKDGVEVAGLSTKDAVGVTNDNLEEKAIKSARREGNRKNTKDATYVRFDNPGINVQIIANSFAHGAGDRSAEYKAVCMNISKIAKVAIPVNESQKTGRNPAIVYLAAVTIDDAPCVVRMVVSSRTGTLNGVKVLHAVKKEGVFSSPAAESTLPSLQGDVSSTSLMENRIPQITSSDMLSVDDFLNFVKDFDVGNSVLSNDVIEKLRTRRTIDKGITPHLRYSLDHDLLRELDGYNTHGDSIGKQGKAVEKMFVQAFKEAKQDSKASIEVYPDTLVAFDNLLPKLRKFVDGTLPDKSIEQLTDELLGIVDKALDNAKGEKKAHPLIESYVGGAITLSPEQAKELKSLGYSVIQYQAMLTKALGYRAHVGVAKSVADMPFGSTLEQDYQTAYDETGDESYNVTAVGLPMDYLEKLQDGDTNYPAFESEEEREFVLYEMVTNLYEKMKANKMLDIEKAIKQDEKTATKKEGYNQGAKDAEKRMSALIESANYAYNAVAAQYEKKIQQLQQDASKARLEGEIDVAMQAAKQVGKLERQLNKSLANQAKLRKEFSTTLKEEKKSMREAFKAEKKKAVSDAELAGEIHVARQAAKQVGNLERKLQKSKEEIVGLKKKPKEAVAKERKRVAQNTAKKAIKKQIRTMDRIYAHPPFLLHSRKGLHIDIRQAQKPPMLWHRGWGWVLPLIFSLLRRRL